jgi:histone H3/H4
MALTFCSVACFQAHVPTLRHRDAWAEEKRAPTAAQWEAERNARQDEESAQAAHDNHDANGAKDDERPVRAVHDRGVGPARTPSVEKLAAASTGQKPAARKELPMSNEVPKEVLVVISKVKAYIRAKSSMNTSDAVTEALSELVRATCDQAIERAKSEGRKTVMARDIPGGGGGSAGAAAAEG